MKTTDKNITDKNIIVTVAKFNDGFYINADYCCQSCEELNPAIVYVINDRNNHCITTAPDYLQILAVKALLAYTDGEKPRRIIEIAEDN